MFLDRDFILENDFASELYHNYAEEMPIIDYHCHLNPKEIYDNQSFANITQAWLGGDHYKWRLMRANGIPEELITGNASDYEKFLAWAATIENAIGNPLYVWTHLELQRIFGITTTLSTKTADQIWQAANQRLTEPEMTTKGLIKKFQVKVICTTDDPIDDLKYHQLLKVEKDFAVYPTFRPDQVFALQADTYLSYLKQLGELTGITTDSYQALKSALSQRISYFHELGGRLSDHSFTALAAFDVSQEKLEELFQKGVTDSSQLTELEKGMYEFGLLQDLMAMYHEKGWAVQLHLKATRNNRTHLLESYGRDAGGDGMGDGQIVQAISTLFDHLDKKQQLPKTILYSLNPNDFIPLMTLLSCFQADIKGKLQLGSGWWFNDTYSGIRHQLTTVAEVGILGNFVGMLTDSRSFLSYPRHEYFRRILCQLISEWAESGQLPQEAATIGQIVEKISYHNAADYFGLTIPE